MEGWKMRVKRNPVRDPHVGDVLRDSDDGAVTVVTDVGPGYVHTTTVYLDGGAPGHGAWSGLGAFETFHTDRDAWAQGWGSTACGHRGAGGQALTTGVVVAAVHAEGRVLIFSQGRLLHDVQLNEAVSAAIARRSVPPAGGAF